MSASRTGRAQGPASWTTAADIETKLRRRWTSGDLLRAHALGEPFESFDLPLRGPSSADLTEHLEAARRWAAGLERAADRGRNFHLLTASVGGRHLGRTDVPGRALIDSYQQAWRLLGVAGEGGEVARFTEVLRLAAQVPAARDWALGHPIRAAELSEEWPAILAARDWLDWNRDTRRHLREIDAPGVDTKVVERHRGVLAAMLGVPSGQSAFLAALGLAAKPSFVRLRFDPALFGMPPEITEASFRLAELGGLHVPLEYALIVENEISYLSAPVPERGVVLWGRGYDASQPASLDWLRPAAAQGFVRYWGDIDTHGFAILNRVRTRLPGVTSVMMDRDTLLTHETRWVHETTPSNAALGHLTDTESALYADLVTDRYGPAVRLEQERIDWAWARPRLG